MCGIVGYVGNSSAEPILLNSLRRLEYRGYDSAGVATLPNEGNEQRTEIRRAAGKLINLDKLLKEKPCPGNIGIGHTRWATHGKPTEHNAHPHYSETITLVHNGIIENHLSLRENLLRQGQTLTSDTDTEIIAHLISTEKKRLKTNLLTATQAAVKKMAGAFALAIIDEQEKDTILCVKQACPLIVGLGENENYIASDFTAILSYTKKFIILEEGDVAVVKKDSVQIYDDNQKLVKREITIVDWPPSVAEKEGFKHFMIKEINEQPVSVTDTLRERLSFVDESVILDNVNLEKLEKIERICIVACGSSFHAGMVAKYFIEELTRIPVELDLASEFRYRSILVNDRSLVLGISQSGETADTIAALKKAGEKGATLLAVCNVIGSSIPRLCNKSAGTLYTRAGPEISVACTKAFTTQIVALRLLTLCLAKQRDQMTSKEIVEHMNDMLHLPVAIESILKNAPAIKDIAAQFTNAADMIFLGRGTLYPIALEGALKMKELSYIHAEGYAAGEMKHGAIALIDENLPVIVIAPQTEVYDKLAANLEEIKARGGRIIALIDEDDTRLKERCEFTISLPKVSKFILPEVATIPLQLLAYYLSDLKGLDVDQPRNLAKSVTVE